MRAKKKQRHAWNRNWKKKLQIMIVGENYEPLKFRLCTPNCKMSLELLYFCVYGKCIVGIISPWKIWVRLWLCMGRAAISCTISYSVARKMTWVSVWVHAYVKRSNTGLVASFFCDLLTFGWGAHDGTYASVRTVERHPISSTQYHWYSWHAHMPHSMNIKC